MPGAIAAVAGAVGKAILGATLSAALGATVTAIVGAVVVVGTVALATRAIKRAKAQRASCSLEGQSRVRRLSAAAWA